MSLRGYTDNWYQSLLLSPQVSLIGYGEDWYQPLLLSPQVSLRGYGDNWYQPLLDTNVCSPQVSLRRYGDNWYQPLLLSLQVSLRGYGDNWYQPLLPSPQVSLRGYGDNWYQHLLLSPQVSLRGYGDDWYQLCSAVTITLSPPQVTIDINICYSLPRWQLISTSATLSPGDNWYQHLLLSPQVTIDINLCYPLPRCLSEDTVTIDINVCCSLPRCLSEDTVAADRSRWSRWTWPTRRPPSGLTWAASTWASPSSGSLWSGTMALAAALSRLLSVVKNTSICQNPVWIQTYWFYQTESQERCRQTCRFRKKSEYSIFPELYICDKYLPNSKLKTNLNSSHFLKVLLCSYPCSELSDLCYALSFHESLLLY